MNRALFAATAGLLFSNIAVAQTSKDIAGCWNMRSLVIEKAGEKTEPYGSRPVGQLILTPDGHFSNIQMRPDLGSTPVSLMPTGGGAVGTLIAYFGTYQMQGSEVTVKIDGSSRADWRNKTQKRTVEHVSPDMVWVDKPTPDLTATVIYDRCPG